MSNQNIDQLFIAAFHRHKAGQLAEAESLYRTILSVAPDHVDCLHLLGVIASKRGEPLRAIELIGRAISLSKVPVSALHNNIGLAYWASGQQDVALSHFMQAVEINSNDVEALNNLGAVLKDLKRSDEAISYYRRALTLDPGHPHANNNLGIAIAERGMEDEASLHFERALTAKKDFADPHINLGILMRRRDRLDEALARFKYAAAIEPRNPSALTNLGFILQEQGKLDEALTYYRQALALDPADALAHFNTASVLLLRGEFERGWEEYEWRRRKNGSHVREFAVPLWNGGDLTGKTILLHAEQGSGDTLQFCRYAPIVGSRTKIILEVQPAVRRLLSGLRIGAPIIAKGEALPSFDLHCPLMSLPRAFGTRNENIPVTVPYLVAEPDRIADWRHRLPHDGFRIGIAWTGSAVYEGRSAPLACFEPIARLPGVRLISLQKAIGLEQLDDLPPGMHVETLGPDFDSGPDAFLDTAAVMMNLDLIVTIDTSIAHLAGALGQPVWIALKSVPDWRWMMDRDDSPWYPTARLFRQPLRGDWQSVFDRMAMKLAQLRDHGAPI